jgi:hypothetical protein
VCNVDLTLQRLGDIIAAYKFHLPKKFETRQEMLQKETAVYNHFAILRKCRIL